jgi:hypothetical protein
MQSTAAVLALLAAACAFWAVIASVRMGVWLANRGVRVHWFLFRGLMPWYVHRYRKMTEELEGGTGPLFPQFVVPINLALLFAVAALVAFGAAGR